MVDRAYITSLLCAPLALPMNILFFQPMITGFWLVYCQIVCQLQPAIFQRNVYSCSLFVLAYCITSSFLMPDLQFHQGTWKDYSALDVYLFHAFPWLGYTLSHILSRSYCPLWIWPYISLWLLSLSLHCHFLFALLRYQRTFSVYAHDIVLS